MHPEIRRHLRIALRTLHIGSACMVLGAAHFEGQAGAWGAVLLGSGLAIVVDDLLKNGLAWLRYLQGWAVLLKTALVALGLAWETALIPTLWLALVIGAFVSHTSGKVRHFALWGPHKPPPPRPGHPGSGRG